MLGAVLIPWLHFAGIIVASGGIVAQLYLLQLAPRPDVVRLLPRVDVFYVIGFLVILASGIGRMLTSGKGGVSYYLHVGLFHGVLTLTIIAIALSLIPTFAYRRWRKALDASNALPTDAQWKAPKKFVHMQIALMIVVALLMVMTARGYGARVATAEGVSIAVGRVGEATCPKAVEDMLLGAGPAFCYS